MVKVDKSNSKNITIFKGIIIMIKKFKNLVKKLSQDKHLRIALAEINFKFLVIVNIQIYQYVLMVWIN